MAKIYERHLSTNISREKGRDSLDPQRENLFGEDSICIVNLFEIPRVIVFFYFLHDCLASVFSEEKFCFFKQKTAYEILSGLVGSEMCIRDRQTNHVKRKKNYYSRYFKQVNNTNTILAQQIFTLGIKRFPPFFP